MKVEELLHSTPHELDQRLNEATADELRTVVSQLITEQRDTKAALAELVETGQKIADGQAIADDVFTHVPALESLAETLQRMNVGQLALIDATEAISQGKLDLRIKLRSSNDLIGLFLNQAVQFVHMLVSAISRHSSTIRQGKLTARINSSLFQGSYGDLIEEINKVLDLFVGFLEKVPAPIMILDRDFTIQYLNQAAHTLLGVPRDDARRKTCPDLFCANRCHTGDCSLARAIRCGSESTEEIVVELNQKERILRQTSIPLTNETNSIIGAINVIHDLTEDHLKSMALETKIAEIEAQKLTIRELSTPVIEIWDEILVLPVIGAMDSKRSQMMLSETLTHIAARRAKFLIIDVTGVGAIDTRTANSFLKVVEAAALLGTRCLLTGLSPAMSQTLVSLGTDLSQVKTRGTLKEGLKECLRQGEGG
jgi:rsbT co-antagonist protein RsbR